EERRDAEAVRASRQLLFETRVEAAVPLGPETRVVRERDLECIGRPDACAGAGPKTCRRMRLAGRRDEIADGDLRVQRVDGLAGKCGARREGVGIGLNGIAGEMLEASAAGEEQSILSGRAHLAERARDAAVDWQDLARRSGDERARSALAQELDAGRRPQ